MKAYKDYVYMNLDLSDLLNWNEDNSMKRLPLRRNKYEENSHS